MQIELLKKTINKIEEGCLIVTDCASCYLIVGKSDGEFNKTYKLIDLFDAFVYSPDFETEEDIIKFIEGDGYEKVIRIIPSDKVVIKEIE